MTLDRKSHWENVYASKAENAVSWFQGTPAPSLDMIRDCATRDSAIIDIGGGASRLVDALLAEDFRSVTVLDLSRAAIEAAKARLGPLAARADWIVADVTQWTPLRRYDVWHDRAAFHFLTDSGDRAAYVNSLSLALPPGGHAIIATFAPDGPERCSGLPVRRYDPAGLARELGPEFELETSLRRVHTTPWGAAQAFQFSRFRRR